MNDWQSTTLQEILSVLESGSRPKGGVRVGENSEGVPSYGGENISTSGGVLYDSVRMVPANFAAGMNRGLLEDKDVLINKDGANTGKSGIYRRPAGENLATINEHLFRLRCKHEIADQEFLFHFLNSQLGKDQIGKVITGSAQPGLNSAFPEFVKIDLPPLPEQKKIAEILSGIDNTINGTQILLQKFLGIKSATINEFCLDACNTLSDSVLLSEVVEHDAPICYGILMPGNHFPGGVPVVKVKNIVNGVIAHNDLLLTDPEIDERYERSRIAEGDLLVTIRGSTGRTAAVPSNLDNANITQDTARVRVKSDINKDLVRIYVESRPGQKYIEDHTIGQAVKGINLADLRKMPIPLGVLDSGTTLANAVASIDSMVSLIRKKTEKLQFYRNAVASYLLSGRKRVSV